VQIVLIHKWLEDIITQSAGGWKVESIFERAVCLHAPNYLVTLNTKCIGPATILVKAPIPDFVEGQVVEPCTLIGNGNYTTWSPPEFLITEKCLTEVNQKLPDLLENNVRSSLLKRPYKDLLIEAIRNLASNFPNLGSGSELLIGLGPGLTPSGDDFLAGYCHVLYHAGIRDLWYQLLPLSDKTNNISSEMIRWACKGVVLGPWEEIVSGLVHGCHEEELYHLKNKAMAVGHSSGTDYLLGCATGFFILGRSQKRFI